MRIGQRLVLAAVCAAAFAATGVFAALVNSTFTYQGQLKMGGMPYDGSAGFEFLLWDAAILGREVATPVNLDLDVVNGLFSAVLDFGAEPFSGQRRWLEISVNTGDGPVVLRPRQEVTLAPYALTALKTVGIDGHSLDAADGSPADAVYVDVDGNVGVGTVTPGSRLTVSGLIESTATGFKFPDGSIQATAGGAPLWQQNGSSIHYNTGNVGVGTSTPNTSFVVERQSSNNINPLAIIRTTGTSSAAAVRFENAAGNEYNFGITGNNDLALGYNANISLSSDVLRITPVGNVGIGTVSPAYRLHVVSDQAYGGYFDSTAAAGSAYGVYGRAEGAAGAAVGTVHYGVYGSAKNAYTNAGVYGEASGGTNNFGGYFQGMLYASGSTGIGNPLPDAKLHVVQTGAADALRVEDQSSDTTPFVIGQAGDVGIGKATPLAKVHIEHTGTADAFRVDDEAADTSPFIVTSDGEVGIGTDNPAWPFVYTKDDEYIAMGYEYHTGAPFPSDEYHSLLVDYDNRASGYLGTHRYSGLNGFRYYGVIGKAFSPAKNYAIYGEAGYGTVNYAGYFAGDVEVNGNLSKSAGSFKIDHPLDPENKYLQHSFVESPDMMNVYNGNVVLDRNGEAAVPMPDYFEALNRDFRYQLTAIGAPGPNLHVAAKIERNQFKIAGGAAGMEVSWQVTGMRKDPYANANRIRVEVEKREADKTRYLHPEVYGFGRERGISDLSAPKQVPETQTAPSSPCP